MEVKAIAKYIRISPRKVRLVLDLIRRLDVEEAENQLLILPQKASKPVLKCLRSAIANALNIGLKKENLYIREIKADEGSTLKRIFPRAHGMAAPIRRRSAHITIVLDEKIPTKKIEEIRTVKKEEIKILGEKPKIEVEEVKKEKKGEETKIIKEKKGFRERFLRRKTI